ncbi:hypothetical protein LY78DRAFT_683495 [Colletotrichum sublineola]|uniref:Uncharacterized protein n=1 Tax=Colletotrichum sublineola TaxID=1173701 RepID=A0A066XN44_COLSU|nr:hypothetical protein LY78DRAFT_683495 [Colletotrichum sublineola]KDN69084.1 hypothetical protein CSUB01_11799 [Colletotrichum sublineola]
MKFTAILLTAFLTGVLAKDCGFPNGPDCKSAGKGANGLEQFVDDGCCVFPARCGNGDGGNVCELVSANPPAKDQRKNNRRRL